MPILNIGVGRWDMRNFKRAGARFDMQHFGWFRNLEMIKNLIIVPMRLMIWLKRLRCYLDNGFCVDYIVFVVYTMNGVEIQMIVYWDRVL